jgi:hypothetical protein
VAAELVASHVVNHGNVLTKHNDSFDFTCVLLKTYNHLVGRGIILT